MVQDKELREFHRKLTFFNLKEYDKSDNFALSNKGLLYRKSVLRALADTAIKHGDYYYSSLYMHEIESMTGTMYTACGFVLKNLCKQKLITDMGRTYSTTRFYRLDLMTNGVLDKFQFCPEDKEKLMLEALSKREAL